ncbi:MAG: Lrp/AsnC family transcriptional regulator [Candidatus Lokiarchaeota archaeon]|nr:Lrp/AsnC family transcriptional regulator [Candidatus Lokiarchaeota archaeon]
MAEHKNLDENFDLDIEILKKLSVDGRISLRRLARDLGNRSPVTIKKHIEEMEEKGIIKDYGIYIDYEELGYKIIALIEITVSKGRMLDVERRIAKNPNVFAVYDITGTYDALILARFKTRAKLSEMIKDVIHASPYVERSNTHIVLNIIKEKGSFVELINKE